ncbi:MAG: hypothetical protein HZB38_00605 [Planctomycetes bacterium]|nr:hypothetical protein [Planctomycetota bacterium]
MMKRLLGAACGFAGLAIPGLAQNCPNVTCDQAPSVGNQVNISGATLLRGFFFSPAHVNDFVDVDGDGCFGYNEFPGAGCIDVVDRLARSSLLTGVSSNGAHPSQNSHWIVQNRAVGSVNGFNEFITYQLCCDLPEARVTDESTINSEIYANGSGHLNFPGVCAQDNDGDSILNDSGTPVCPCSIDIAILDVPGAWGSQGPAGTPSPFRKPTQPGYGVFPGSSVAIPGGCSDVAAWPANLALLTRGCTGRQLNFNTANPDADTLFDTTFAFAPIGAISNRGVGRTQIRVTELQHLQVTGRLPSGENLAAATRDAGSGTRNGWCNSLGIDPAWGNGDNRGDETSSTSRTNLGPCHRVTNCGSSSHLENGVQQRRLAIGYSGLAGGTAAVKDAADGFYEILDVMNDHVGGTQYVRPTVSTILDNCDPDLGYRIGGPASFVTLGDPQATGNGAAISNANYNPASPAFMVNVEAANYLYNITASIDAFVGAPTADTNLFSPGQFLAVTFFLLAGQDCNQSVIDPVVFNPVTPNATLQSYIRNNNNFGAGLTPDGVVTPAYGSRNPAGLVPNRGTAYQYNIGTVASPNLQSIGAGQRLAIRNRVQGDFLYDFQRNANDIPNMMSAVYVALNTGNAANYTDGALTPPGGEAGDPGQQAADRIIPDVIGDFDGNGAFDPADIRYFADGLVLVSGSLNRQAGFTSVDASWTVGTGGRPAGNFFNTVITNSQGVPQPYVAGASRFDVAGSSTGAAKGDAPIGSDGIVNLTDVNYVLANFGSWSSLTSAATIDLSCDMTGDLVVNQADVDMILAAMGEAHCQGDFNADGVVDIGDLTLLLSHFGVGSGASYGDGDMNGDGAIDLSDLTLFLSKFGSIYPNCL